MMEQQQQQLTNNVDEQQHVIRIHVHHYHSVASSNNNNNAVVAPLMKNAPIAASPSTVGIDSNNDEQLRSGAVVRIACNGRVLHVDQGHAVRATLKAELSKELIPTSQWTVHVVTTPKRGDLHALCSVSTGRFLRVCKDGSVDCRGKLGGGLTLFKVTQKARSVALKSVATGLFLAPNVGTGSVSSSSTASFVRVRPTTVRVPKEPKRLPPFQRRHHGRPAGMGHVVIKLQPAAPAPVPLAPAAVNHGVASKKDEEPSKPALNKEERIRAKQERMEERMRAKQERVQARINAKAEKRAPSSVPAAATAAVAVPTANPVVESAAAAFPHIGATVTLMPKAFFDMPNRSQEKGWHLGIAPQGFVVADAASGPWSQFRVLSGKDGNIIFESTHTPAWHLAVRPNLQMTHKGGKGKFAQFVATRHEGDFWSFRCATHGDAFLAVTPQGVLHVAQKADPQTTLFKLNVVA